jgi:hypothetical protein
MTTGYEKYGHDYRLRARPLYIFSYHIDLTCRSYLTKIKKILKWGKTVFKVSELRHLGKSSTKWVIYVTNA